MKKHNITQQTDEWFHLRKGKITGTALKGIMGTAKAKEGVIYDLIAEKLSVGIGDDENPMDRGNRLEPEAIEVKCMGGKNHIKMLIENKIPDEYYWQAIQYFVVNERLEKLYFVGYNPDIPARPLIILEMNETDVKEDILLAKQSQLAALKEVDEIINKFDLITF